MGGWENTAPTRIVDEDAGIEEKGNSKSSLLGDEE